VGVEEISQLRRSANFRPSSLAFWVAATDRQPPPMTARHPCLLKSPLPINHSGIGRKNAAQQMAPSEHENAGIDVIGGCENDRCFREYPMPQRAAVRRFEKEPRIADSCAMGNATLGAAECTSQGAWGPKLRWRFGAEHIRGRAGAFKITEARPRLGSRPVPFSRLSSSSEYGHVYRACRNFGADSGLFSCLVPGAWPRPFPSLPGWPPRIGASWLYSRGPARERSR
jgi:hypothetical protein